MPKQIVSLKALRDGGDQSLKHSLNRTLIMGNLSLVVAWPSYMGILTYLSTILRVLIMLV